MKPENDIKTEPPPATIESPLEHCDIVTSTVHKTLRGPRAESIFFRGAFTAWTGTVWRSSTTRRTASTWPGASTSMIWRRSWSSSTPDKPPQNKFIFLGIASLLMEPPSVDRGNKFKREFAADPILQVGQFDPGGNSPFNDYTAWFSKYGTNILEWMGHFLFCAPMLDAVLHTRDKPSTFMDEYQAGVALTHYGQFNSGGKHIHTSKQE